MMNLTEAGVISHQIWNSGPKIMIIRLHSDQYRVPAVTQPLNMGCISVLENMLQCRDKIAGNLLRMN